MFLTCKQVGVLLFPSLCYTALVLSRVAAVVAQAYSVTTLPLRPVSCHAMQPASISVPANFTELGEHYKLHKDITDFMVAPEPGGLGLESMADFADLFTCEKDADAVMQRIVSQKDSARMLSRLRQAWRGVKRALDAGLELAKKSADCDDLDKLLDQPVLEDLRTQVWKRYKSAWPPEITPGDGLISRVFREIAARLLSVREVWRVKSLADQLRSARRTITMGGGAEMRFPEEQDDIRVIESYEAYIQLLWILLLAYAFTGARPLDPPPANRP